MKTFRKKPLRKASAKAQSAMEYLMTYGWAILIMAVVLAALFQLGVFNPMTFAPKAPPGACQVFRPNGPYTTSFINLEGVCSGELPQYVAEFNGANAYIQSPAIANKKSVSVWIKTISTTQQLILDGGVCGTTDQAYQLALTQTGGVGGSPPQNTPGVYVTFWADDIYIPNMNLADGTWHNIVLSWNGGSQVYLMVDGKLPQGYLWNGNSWSSLSSQPFTMPSTPNPANQPILIGEGRCQIWSVGSTNLSGSIANVQLYNTSLSANEIQALYLEGIGGAPIDLQHLVGWWPLNGNANDYSGNGNNGQTNNVNFVSNWYSGYTPP